MTLIIGMGTADGIVIAGDTRFTYTAFKNNSANQTEVHFSYLDGGKKILLSQSHTNYGVAYMGAIHQGQLLLTPEVILAEFDRQSEGMNYDLEKFAEKFRTYYQSRISSTAPNPSIEPNTLFWVFGLDILDQEPKVFELAFPGSIPPKSIIGGEAGYMFRWGGSGKTMMARMILGVDENLAQEIESTPGIDLMDLEAVKSHIGNKFELTIKNAIMPIDDAADFSESIIQTVHLLEKYAGNMQGVGPYADVLSITKRMGSRFIRGRMDPTR